jgi:3-methyladenine DNA glycosylase AlkD
MAAKRPPSRKATATKRARRADTGGTPAKIDEQVAEVLAALMKLGNKQTRDSLPRYGIFVEDAFGVPVSEMQAVAKRIGRNHDLAMALWDTGRYEPRMVAAFLADPALLTSADMDRWCRDFDNWGICDTVCFHLFDRTPYALRKVEQWADSGEEFVKRGAFALLACVALHDKKTIGDEAFLDGLSLVEAAAGDDRNFVKKGVSWALRAIGRRNRQLNEAAVEVARRLSNSSEPAARWIEGTHRTRSSGASEELTLKQSVQAEGHGRVVPVLNSAAATGPRRRDPLSRQFQIGPAKSALETELGLVDLVPGLLLREYDELDVVARYSALDDGTAEVFAVHLA